MTEKTYQVGDVAPWRKVRPGSLVRQGAGDYALRIGDRHHWVRLANTIQMDWARVGACGGWLFDDGEEVDEGPVTIIALDVPADATADDLRRLAEVFEVREALAAALDADDAEWFWSCDADKGRDSPHAVIIELDDGMRTIVADDETRDDALQNAAKRLHAAGWRPGMSAEDAARLLAEQEATCRR